MGADNYQKVGLIGLGIIGKGVADVLRGSGRDVYVWNRTPKPEPNFLGSPAEVARLANVIQIFVSDGAALLEVMEAMKPRLTSAHIVLNHATVDPASTVRAYEIAHSCGADFLDAPFTGSKDAAAGGNLVYYIGGNPAILDMVRPLLELSAKEILYIGKIGEASLIKIATNMISAATIGVLSEAYALTKAAGIDPAILQNAIEHNGCSSALTSLKLPSIIEGNYETHFSLNNMFKDTKFALDLTKQFQVDAPVLTTTVNVMYRSIQKGLGDLDFSSVAINYQEAQ